jgi:hypothetical protein
MPCNTIKKRFASTIAQARRLWASESGVVLVEFAYTLPIFAAFGFVGIETANYAVNNMRASMIAMTVADNMSRAKQSVPLGLPQLREVDINDALIGARIQGGDKLQIFENGRIIVSSLQRDGSGRQWIAWQRCKGKLTRQSLYGVQGDRQPTSGASGFQGMGQGSNRVRAEPNSAIIFAEVVYRYQPIMTKYFFGNMEIRREAAFYVRDDRDLTGGPELNGVYNPNPTASRSGCNLYNSTF